MESWNIQVKEQDLSGGLRALAIEMPHVHTATVFVLVRAGSRYETPETNGIGHLLEHMIFRGTEKYPNSYELARAVEALGASFNAETSRDAAVYYIETVPRHLARAADLLAEMFRAPRFADLDIEKEIVLEEMNEDYNEEGLLTDLDSLTRPRLWPSHPMGFAVIGIRENVERIDVEDLRAHWDRLYVSGNMLVCGAGNIDAADFFAHVEDAFSFVSEGPGVQQKAPRPSATGSSLWVPNPDSQVSVNLAWPALPDPHPDHAALSLLRRALDDGLSSRLHRRIVDEEGLAYDVEASIEGYHDAGAFEIQAGLAPRKLPAVMSVLAEILDDLCEREVDEEELAKVRERSLCDLETLQDDVEHVTEWLAGGILHGLRHDPKQIAERVRRVTPEQIQKVAREVLRRDSMHVTIVGNVAEDVRDEALRALD